MENSQQKSQEEKIEEAYLNGVRDAMSGAPKAALEMCRKMADSNPCAAAYIQGHESSGAGE